MSDLQGGVAADLQLVKTVLRLRGIDPRQLFPPNAARGALDILVDAAIIICCVFATIESNWIFSPVALIVVGSRQRSIGNLLHDASHGSIGKSRFLNDAIGGLVLGPLALVDFSTYRERHNLHHRCLGISRDPDLIHIAPGLSRNWFSAYWHVFTSRSAMLDSVFGHLRATGISPMRRLAILVWWALALFGLSQVAGEIFAATLLAIWFLSRISTFHAITTFREMCDHYGLRSGGILQYTRDVHGPFLTRAILHPKNNGWHLTHHLLPMVPFRFLPDARRLLDSILPDCQLSFVRHSYFFGSSPVVGEWRAAGSEGG